MGSTVLETLPQAHFFDLLATLLARFVYFFVKIVFYSRIRRRERYQEKELDISRRLAQQIALESL